MKIKNAMILAAGLGRRMQPLTLKTPKPLLKIGNENLLERAINLLIDNDIQKIVINIHHLGDQIKKFVKNKKYNVDVSISDETDSLLETGGGILYGTSSFNSKEPLIVINPDTLWHNNYSQDLKDLTKLYFKENKPCMLLVNKDLSFDKSFTGDFTLNGSTISKEKNNQFIFTGLQIINREIFLNETEKIFSMNKIWNKLIQKKNLLGLKSKQNFYHLNTLEMYKKISSLKIID